MGVNDGKYMGNGYDILRNGKSILEAKILTIHGFCLVENAISTKLFCKHYTLKT